MVGCRTRLECTRDRSIHTQFQRLTQNPTTPWVPRPTRRSTIGLAKLQRPKRPAVGFLQCTYGSNPHPDFSNWEENSKLHLWLKIHFQMKIVQVPVFTPAPRNCAPTPLFAPRTRTYPHISIPTTLRHGIEVGVSVGKRSGISENRKIEAWYPTFKPGYLRGKLLKSIGPASHVTSRPRTTR